MNLTLLFYKNVGEMHSPLSASFITTTFLRLNGVNTSTIDLISNIGNSLSSRKLYCPNSQLDQDHLLAEIDKFVELKILRVDTTTWKNFNLPLIVHPFQCQAAPELSSWFFPAEEVLLPAKQHKSARKSISVLCRNAFNILIFQRLSMKQNVVRYVFQPSNTLKRCKGHSQCNMSLSSLDNSDHQLWTSQLLSASSK